MNIEEIKKKIQIILELPQLKPFGGIYMNPVLEEAKVAQIEKENRITFPSDYRTFITQIANGCVGPDYGLRSLKEATEDLMWKDRTIDLSTPFPYIEHWNEEEWLNSIDWDGGERPTQEQLETYMDTKHISGCLQICHIGHGASYLLVVNGKEKGYIWLDSRQDYGGLSPELNEKGEKLTFEMWYTEWLNEVVAPEKIKKKGDHFNLNLIPTVDILASLGTLKTTQKLIGFALETENEIENARTKLQKKHLDGIVLNSLRDKGAGFGTDTNKITFITPEKLKNSL